MRAINPAGSDTVTATIQISHGCRESPQALTLDGAEREADALAHHAGRARQPVAEAPLARAVHHQQTAARKREIAAGAVARAARRQHEAPGGPERERGHH